MAKADYNPDREGHAAHKWEVINATKGPLEVELDGKQMKFGKDGAFRVSDPGVAAALRQKYHDKGLATVTRIRTPDPIADRGHRYFFGAWPEMPWKRGNHGIKEEGKQEEGTSGLCGSTGADSQERGHPDEERRGNPG